MVLLVVMQQVVPQRMTSEDLRVAHDNTGVLGSGQSDIETPRVRQEPDTLVLVTPDTGNDDNVFLSALEGVYAGNFEVLVDLGVEGTLVLKVLHQEGPLALVRGHNPNLVRLHPGLKELCYDLLHVGRLGPVEEARAAPRDLLLAAGYVEHHWLVHLGPGKVNWQLPVFSIDPVLQRALIEEVGGELGEGGMHPVLNLQSERSNAKHNQPLEQGLAEAPRGCLLAHDHGPKLAVVAHQDQLLGAQHSWHHTLGLGGLHALVNQDTREPHPDQLGVSGPNTRAADDIGHVQELLLALLPQDPVPLLVAAAQLAGFLLQHLQLGVLRVALDLLDLVVQGEVGHRCFQRLSGLGADPDHLQTSLVHLLAELVHGGVAGGADQDRAAVQLDQLVDDGGRGHSLPSSRWPLDQ